MNARFDTVIMVDWAGGNDRGPTPKADAIWACIARAGRPDRPIYMRHRLLARAWITRQIEMELEAGRRCLVGFDFPFGYPQGFGRALTGSDDPFAVWQWIAERIEDLPKSNNRFEIAGEINRLVGGGKGPFWGNGKRKDVDGLPRTKQGYANPFADRRAAEERAKGAFTCWQMSGAGSVGGQVLTGLPMLQHLRKRFGDALAVWPFEPLGRAEVALVEIWPSLTVGPAPDGMIKDAWQVQEVARSVSSLEPDSLARMLDVPRSPEGWIFGLGFEDTLRAVAAGPPPLADDCFALPPGVDWIPVDDALDRLRASLRPVVGTDTVSLSQAGGRVLARDVVARRSNPPQTNTAVDGYGFAGGRGEGPHELPLVAHRAAAGDLAAPVPDGHAIRILTGAALPEGVDTVILQEDVTLRPGSIAFRGPVKPGANTRQAGEDMAEGEAALVAGSRLRAPDLALAAAVGHGALAVRESLRVGVLSTGDELVEPGRDAGPGRIFDANRPMLLELIRRFGHVPVDLGHVPDERAELRRTLDGADAQAILTSGGASSGDEDHVSALLGETGALQSWRIAVKPGRPLALGLWQGKPVFGLPGNPVAALVCALVFARPALAVLAGQTWPQPEAFMLPAGFSKRKKPGRREYLRARLRDGRVEVFASEGSGRVSGLSWAEGLCELPDDAVEIKPGTPVRFLPYASFGV